MLKSVTLATVLVLASFQTLANPVVINTPSVMALAVAADKQSPPPAHIEHLDPEAMEKAVDVTLETVLAEASASTEDISTLEHLQLKAQAFADAFLEKYHELIGEDAVNNALAEPVTDGSLDPVVTPTGDPIVSDTAVQGITAVK